MNCSGTPAARASQEKRTVLRIEVPETVSNGRQSRQNLDRPFVDTRKRGVLQWGKGGLGGAQCCK